MNWRRPSSKDKKKRMGLGPKVGLDRRRADNIKNNRPELMSQLKGWSRRIQISRLVA